MFQLLVLLLWKYKPQVFKVNHQVNKVIFSKTVWSLLNLFKILFHETVYILRFTKYKNKLDKILDHLDISKYKYKYGCFRYTKQLLS